MTNVATRIIRNQLSRVPLLRMIRDSLARPLEKYYDLSYNIGVCRHHLLAVRKHGSKAPAGQVIVEIGPGGNLGNAVILVALGAKRVYCVDNYRHIDFQSQRVAFYRKLTSGLLDDPGFLALCDRFLIDRDTARARLRDAIAVVGDLVELNSDKIQYIAPCNAENIPLESASVDLLFSHAVLEHVRSPRDVCGEFGRVAKAGAYTSHVIDLRDHFDPTGLDMLRYSSRLWDFMASNSHGYVNRCRAVQFESIFNGAGFELPELEVTALLDDIGRLPKQIAETFSNLSVDQLRVLGLSLVGIRAG